ncbi:MAG: DNA polymerase III subunit gamma/tau [Novipirellula sp. JB048]
MPEPTGPQDAPKQDSYVVVARRYRPRGFDQLVGQDHVGRALKNAIETNRVGHAYLFTGARGVGKTSTARIFAKALNDPSGPTATPDNSTDVAQAIDSGEDVDVIEIDGASNRGIDEIRSLRANVGVRPSRSRYKIYIIDEVHMLTGAAFNALLKTLEEPPEHVKFIFCTTDPEKLPITVLSRCQRFDFAPVEVPKIVDRLREIVHAEQAEADEKALELIARRAAGSMRDSQSLLEQVLSFSDGKLTAEQVHAMLGTADDERLHALAQAMAQRDAAEVIRQLDAGIDAGVDAGRLAEQLLAYFRDLMAVTVGCDASLMRHTSTALYDELSELGQRWGLQTVLAVVGLVDQTLVRIRHSVYARVLLEATAIQICNLPDLQQIADLAAAADSIAASPTHRGGAEKKNRVANAAPPAAPPATSVAATSAAAGPATRAAAAATPPANPAALSPPTATPTPAAAAPSPNPSPPRPATAVAWNQANAQRIWNEAITTVEPMTETLAREVTQVVAEEGKLRLIFPGESKLAFSRCESPQHKTQLHTAVANLGDRREADDAEDQDRDRGVHPAQRIRLHRVPARRASLSGTTG